MRLVGIHLKAELLALFRVPGFLIPSIGFPPLFFIMFAAPNATNTQVANQLTASFMTFAVFTVVFFQFGVNTAQERENPWYTYLKTLPAPPLTRTLALLATGLLFAAMAALAVALTGSLSTPLEINAGTWTRLSLALLLGAVPMGLLGVSLAYLFSPRAALPVANLIYLPLSFLGGLWMPPEILPRWAQRVSVTLPTRHWAELVWASVRDRPWPQTSLLFLALYTLAFATLAGWAWRRARPE